MEKINEIWEEHKDKIFLIVISIVILSVLLFPGSRQLRPLMGVTCKYKVSHNRIMN
jgi:hypothetical protein